MAATNYILDGFYGNNARAGVAKAGKAWARTTTTATITDNGHALPAGTYVAITVTSDAAAIPLGTYLISNIQVNTFDITVPNAGGASGTVTYAAPKATMPSNLTVQAPNNDTVQIRSTLPVDTGLTARFVHKSNILKVLGNNTFAKNVCMGGNLVYAATWTRSTTTATVTYNGHGLNNNDVINVVITSAATAIPALTRYVITKTDANIFTMTCLNAGASSGTLTYEPSFVASANVTATLHTTAYKKQYASHQLAIAGAFTTGKVAYMNLGVVQDLSSKKVLSFWMREQTSYWVANALKIRLCSDAAGDTVIGSCDWFLPASSSGYVNYTTWMCITVDLGGAALPNNVQSIGIYAQADPGAITPLFDNMVAFDYHTDATGLSFEHIFGKARKAYWVASATPSLNVYCRPTATFGSNMVYKCTLSGQSAASEPNWDYHIGSVTVDGAAQWTCMGYEEGWYTARYFVINGSDTDIYLDSFNLPGATPAHGYYSMDWPTPTSTEDVALWKIRPCYNFLTCALNYVDYAMMVGGPIGYSCSYSGGWDAAYSAIEGMTYIYCFGLTGYMTAQNVANANATRKSILIKNIGYVCTGSGYGNVGGLNLANNGNAPLYFRNIRIICSSYAINGGPINGMTRFVDIEHFSAFQTAPISSTGTVNAPVGLSWGDFRGFCIIVYGQDSSIGQGLMVIAGGPSYTTPIAANNPTTVLFDEVMLLMGWQAAGYVGFQNNSGVNVRIKNLKTADNYGGGMCSGAPTTLEDAVITEASETFNVVGYQFTKPWTFSYRHEGSVDKIFGSYVICQKNTATVRSGGSGTSWQVSPTDTTWYDANNPVLPPLNNGKPYQAKCFANVATTVYCYIYRDNAGITAGIRVRALGALNGIGTTDLTAASTSVSAWDLVSITFTPTENGYVDVEPYCYGGTTFNAYFMDFYYTPFYSPNYNDFNIPQISSVISSSTLNWATGTSPLSRLKKNTAFAGFEFVMFDAITNLPKTGLTVTSEVSIDGAAFTACTNAAAEVASGTYKIDLDAADVNGDFISLLFTATGAHPTILTLPLVHITKNTVFSNFEFVMFSSSTREPVAGLTVTATRSIDGAAFGACANAVAEVGSGVYKIDLAAADLNGNNVMLHFTASGANATDVSLVTEV